ncbi:MAG: elongation factor P maturation arginine rhamnosyltransferase EarP, partial [Limnohabitans sp.]
TFLERTQAPAVVAQAHWAWNSDTPQALPELTPPNMAEWANWAAGICENLAQQTDLVERLRAFVETKG